MEAERRHDIIVPYLCTKGAERAIAFYTEVFGAKELDRYQDAPGDPIGHATLEINGATLYLADEFPEINVLSPTTIGGSAVTIHLLLPDVDEATRRAVECGATLLRAPADQGYGERNSKLVDPFGHVWMIATRTS